MNIFDMHIHSLHSDGKLSVREIFELAKERNIKGISITDHDNIDAMDQALSLSIEYGVDFISGIELSAHYKGFEMHILGYNFDHKDKDLNDFLKILRSHRIKRAFKIVDLLNENGIMIDKDDLDAYSLDSVGRPHIAELLIKKGYAKDKNDAFRKYLGDGSKYFVDKLRLPLHDAISLIKNAGGFTSLAHPKLLKEKSLLDAAIEFKIDAIEAFHSKQSKKDSEYFMMKARRNRLQFTGGSDFHGYEDDYETIGRYGIDDSILKSVMEKLSNNDA